MHRGAMPAVTYMDLARIIIPQVSLLPYLLGASLHLHRATKFLSRCVGMVIYFVLSLSALNPGVVLNRHLGAAMCKEHK